MISLKNFYYDSNRKFFYQACFSGSPQVSDLHELFPDLPSDDIEKALTDCGGNIEAAVSTLLDNGKYLQ